MKTVKYCICGNRIEIETIGAHRVRGTLEITCKSCKKIQGVEII